MVVKERSFSCQSLICIALALGVCCVLLVNQGGAIEAALSVLENAPVHTPRGTNTHAVYSAASSLITETTEASHQRTLVKIDHIDQTAFTCHLASVMYASVALYETQITM